MNRNPNNLGPRTLRDCTFQDWADPFERPAERTKEPVTVLIGAAFVIGLIIWGLL